MKKLAFVVFFLPVAAWAQAPGPLSGPQQVASFLAANLTAAMDENDKLRMQLADLQKQLAEAKKAAPADVPKQ